MTFASDMHGGGVCDATQQGVDGEINFLWLVENMERCVIMSKGIDDGPWWMVYSLLNGCDYTYVDVN